MNRIQVAIAILYRNDQFLMQLRDNIPTIVYAGFWGLFGGHIEPGETSELAVERELLEEIGYQIPSIAKFGVYEDEKVVRHVFHAPLTVEVSELVLMEGWDLGLLTVDDIVRGDRYSKNADQVRSLGATHQQILLDFIKSSHHPSRSQPTIST
ncbi:NUDIX hydrolase [Myxacorys almedinensis]|uniref:NUDIX domain-containing protein n=1 Tax=Myxacorys almedinensis A TaxID=2690445 RepID=A0A8J7YYK9_9CYAN|nr:NUDIX hydrolase [Myxacorys almedinensis]NDJ16919.1 NUDIX domain-containing protein [Myxacorys almedinensis A]